MDEGAVAQATETLGRITVSTDMHALGCGPSGRGHCREQGIEAEVSQATGGVVQPGAYCQH